MTQEPEKNTRPLKSRLKKKRRFSHASQLWLERQINDPYVLKAREENYRSRSAYKLIQIDEKHKIFHHAHCVVDLGSAPGGWAQVAAQRMKNGKIISVDLLEMDPVPGVSFLKMDFTDPESVTAIKDALEGRKVSGVISDMAANTTGHKKTDYWRTIGLAEAAFDFAEEVLEKEGFFLTKLFQGGETENLLHKMKKCFSKVYHIKPAASRLTSSEVYVLSKNFRKISLEDNKSNNDPD